MPEASRRHIFSGKKTHFLLQELWEVTWKDMNELLCGNNKIERCKFSTNTCFDFFMHDVPGNFD